MSDCDVVLDDRYSLADSVESVSLEEGLQDIAARASVNLVVTSGFPILGPGQALQVFWAGKPIFDGVVWECSSVARGRKQLTVTAYDRTVYLAKSEDECLLPAGETAAQRLRRYAAAWGVGLGSVADTKVALAKDVRRSQSIYSMIRADLVETVRKGGGMFRARMAGRTLELAQLGANLAPWLLTVGQNVSEVSQRRTLEGSRTKVKVLGQATGEELAEVRVTALGDTARFGTLQGLLQDSRITTPAEAKTAGEQALVGLQETLSVGVLGIEPIRAGDVADLDGVRHLVTRVAHNLAPGPGRMSLDLASADHVRRLFYA